MCCAADCDSQSPAFCVRILRKAAAATMCDDLREPNWSRLGTAVCQDYLQAEAKRRKVRSMTARAAQKYEELRALAEPVYRFMADKRMVHVQDDYKLKISHNVEASTIIIEGVRNRSSSPPTQVQQPRPAEREYQPEPFATLPLEDDGVHPAFRISDPEAEDEVQEDPEQSATVVAGEWTPPLIDRDPEGRPIDMDVFDHRIE